jgi:hypothetical protein
LKDNIAAFAAVSSVGSAARHKFFPPETYTTVTTMTGLDINFCFINKFHVKLFLEQKDYTSFKEEIFTIYWRKFSAM